MQNELNQHKNSDKIKWILTLTAFILMGATLCGVVFGWITPNTNNTKENTEQTATIEGSYETELVSTTYVKLASMTDMSKVANASYEQQTLVATIYPDIAHNKLVDWTVAWAEENEANVGDFVTVHPTFDGSNTVEVRCHQPFETNVVITVITREGGYTAECIVRYVGVPSIVNIDANVAMEDNYYVIGVGNTYDFNIGITNIFDVIGDEYKELNVVVKGYGAVVLGSCDYTDKNYYWYEDSLETVNLDEILDDILDFEYDNGVLSVTTKKSINGYYETMKRIDGGRTISYTRKFKEFSPSAYFLIEVKQPNCGFTQTFKLKIDPYQVTGVETGSEILF